MTTSPEEEALRNSVSEMLELQGLLLSVQPLIETLPNPEHRELLESILEVHSGTTVNRLNDAIRAHAGSAAD